MDSKTILIPAMVDDDSKIIESELQQIEGVRSVKVYQPTHSVTVVWVKPATWDAINRRLLELKFAPDLPQRW